MAKRGRPGLGGEELRLEDGVAKADADVGAGADLPALPRGLVLHLFLEEVPVTPARSTPGPSPGSFIGCTSPGAAVRRSPEGSSRKKLRRQGPAR